MQAAIDRRRYAVFAVVSVALLTSSMNLTVAFVVLPQMQEGLGVSLTWVGWTVTAYQLASAVSMSLAGGIADRYGRRRIFIAALALFCIGSAAAAFAPNIATHILMRMAAALGGGAIVPIAAGVVSREFPHSRARAIGLFTSVLPLGWIIGPTVGGFIAEHLTWRGAFLLPAPLAVVALVGAAFLMRESAEGAKGRLDVQGALLLAAAIASFMLSLSLFRVEGGAAWMAAWGLLALSVPLGALFWRNESRAEEPIVDLALLRMRPFAAANAYNVVWGGVSIGSSAFIPLYAALEFDLDSARAGSTLVGLEVALIAGSMLTSIWLLHRLGYRPLIFAGGVLLTAVMMSVGFGLIRALPAALPPFWALFGVLTIGGFAMGIQAPASNNAGIELMPSRVSSIVGLRGTFRFAGSVITTTVIFFLLAGFEDAARGVEVIYLGLGALMLAAAPLIFLMPTGREHRIDTLAEHAATREAQATGE